jgi:hypothetical protein
VKKKNKQRNPNKTGYIPKQHIKVTSQKTGNAITKVIIIVSVFLVIILLLFFYFSQQESPMVGRWKLADYSDNVIRKDTALIRFQKDTEALKRMMLILNDDKSYTRNLDQNYEMGKWSVSEDGKFFITKPKAENVPEVKMTIESVSKDKLVLLLYEGEVITRFTFIRQN